MLADVLHRCGLLTKRSNNLIPYMMEIYRGKDSKKADGFKKEFFSRMQTTLHRGLGHRRLHWVAMVESSIQ